MLFFFFLPISKWSIIITILRRFFLGLERYVLESILLQLHLWPTTSQCGKCLIFTLNYNEIAKACIGALRRIFVLAYLSLYWYKIKVTISVLSASKKIFRKLFLASFLKINLSSFSALLGGWLHGFLITYSTGHVPYKKFILLWELLNSFEKHAPCIAGGRLHPLRQSVRPLLLSNPKITHSNSVLIAF